MKKSQKIFWRSILPMGKKDVPFMRRRNMIDLRCGDSFELLKTLDDASVDMVMTSPPYDNLRDYNGYTFNFEGIANELYRVVKDGDEDKCSIWRMSKTVR